MSCDPVRREAHAWVRRLASGEATVADADALKRWCEASAEHAAAFADAQRLWQDFDSAGRQLLQRRQLSPASIAVTERHWSRRAFLGGALTATAAVAIVAVAYPPFAWWPPAAEWDADYRTATGEQKQLRLADGVSVALNTQTSIALQTSGGDMPGIRLIAGEAAVDSVGLARPFSVIAGAGRTWTRGDARFEIRHDGDQVCVTCLAGEIEVEHGTQRRTLWERQRLFYGAEGMQAAAAIDTALVSAWREGVVVFRRTPLSEAVAEINRYRPGHVLLLDKKLGANVVSGRFGIRDMDHVITQIQEAFGVRVTTLPGNVILLS